MTPRDLTDRIAALDVIEPPPGWVERAINRFRRSTMTMTTLDIDKSTGDRVAALLDAASVHASPQTRDLAARVAALPQDADHERAREILARSRDLDATERMLTPRDKISSASLSDTAQDAMERAAALSGHSEIARSRDDLWNRMGMIEAGGDSLTAIELGLIATWIGEGVPEQYEELAAAIAAKCERLAAQRG